MGVGDRVFAVGASAVWTKTLSTGDVEMGAYPSDADDERSCMRMRGFAEDHLPSFPFRGRPKPELIDRMQSISEDTTDAKVLDPVTTTRATSKHISVESVACTVHIAGGRFRCRL